MSTNPLSPASWANHFEAFKTSGLSRKAYCEQNHLIYHQFQYYYRHHHLKIPHHKKQQKRSMKVAPLFFPVKMKSPTPSDAYVELRFPNGLSCRLPLSVEPETLKSFIEVLQS